MERVTLLHVGDEVDAATLTQLCQPRPRSSRLRALFRSPRSRHAEVALPAEAERDSAGAGADRGQCGAGGAAVGGEPGYGALSHAALWDCPAPARGRRLPPASLYTLRGAGRSQSHQLWREGQAGHAPAEPADARTPPRADGRGSNSHRDCGGAERQARGGERAERPHPSAAWEQKPVVVLALELTWPEANGLESPRYDPWTEMARWEQAIVDKVQGFGGVLLQRTPALLTWVFGLPQTLEQLPQRAVHSALAIRQMVVEASAPDLPPCPEVRLAVHLGAVRVDHQAADPTARLLAGGRHPGAPGAAARASGTGGDPDHPRGGTSGGRLGGSGGAAGAIERRPIHARRWVCRHRGQPRARGVGRTSAPTAKPLRRPGAGAGAAGRVLEQVKAGRGQVVSLVGAPGMGKSRLLQEFRQRLIGQRVRYAEGQCLAYGSAIPYLPVLDLLRDHCGIAEGDDPEALAAKMRLALERSGGDLAAELPLLLDLLGVPVEADRFAELSADGRRARTFEALYQMFLASSRQQPLVLAVDNLHWIDPTSEAFLAGLIERLASVPLLVLTTTRPGYRPPWGDRSYVMQLALPPLDPDASRQVVQQCARPPAPGARSGTAAPGQGGGQSLLSGGTGPYGAGAGGTVCGPGGAEHYPGGAGRPHRPAATGGEAISCRRPR